MKHHERKCTRSSSATLSAEEGGAVSSKKDVLDHLGGQEGVSELQFLRFGLLHMNLVSESDINLIMDAFQAYSPEGGIARRKSILQDHLTEADSENEQMSGP